MTITSPNVSTCLRFAPCVEPDSATTSSDKSITLSVACTSLRLFVPRAGRDVAPIISLVKSMPAVWGSAVPSATAGCAFARPLPLEVRVVVVDALESFTEEDCEVEAVGDGGGGGGLANSSVHRRAVWSCVGRLRRNSVAMDGTTLDKWVISAGTWKMVRVIPNGSARR
jgi:hypothetical protein